MQSNQEGGGSLSLPPLSHGAPMSALPSNSITVGSSDDFDSFEPFDGSATAETLGVAGLVGGVLGDPGDVGDVGRAVRCFFTASPAEVLGSSAVSSSVLTFASHAAIGVGWPTSASSVVVRKRFASRRASLRMSSGTFVSSQKERAEPSSSASRTATRKVGWTARKTHSASDASSRSRPQTS